MKTPLRVWCDAGFVLAMWKHSYRDGRTYIRYKLWDSGRLIFRGTDYSPSPMHCIDGDLSVAGLLAFLSVGKGDTDSDYFREYTRAQIEWRDSARREELSYLQFEMEERAEKEYRKGK